MDTSYLAQQVNSSITQLHGLFDEIGVPSHERQARESELFAALSEALNSQVRLVSSEKKQMMDEAKDIITTIRQMEASLDNAKPKRDLSDEEFKVTYPLNRCLQNLKEQHTQIKRLHTERFEQVKKLVQALESYSSHLEATFVQIPLPPTGANQTVSPTFDLSPAYVDRLDKEFTRVYEEYTRRIASVQSLADNVIQLWAELGIPQAQQDGTIVKYYREAPEQLGLHEEDVKRMQGKRDRLMDEKKNREKKLKDLKALVESLWIKLAVDEAETKQFLNANRGCGLRQINEFEDELARLNELKRENLHLFVEDSRVQLQELWDALYFSEDEMLEFTPAFSDVYSDALLEAHEREIARLEAIKDQRAPTLALVERHKTLVKERDDLATSSQDASRLMLRGQKGEKRDPGKLLREEKMRKRIAKELPRVAVEVRKALEKWEDEYGKPFLVHGERYIEELEPDDSKRAGPMARAKTPAGPASAMKPVAPRSTVKPAAARAMPPRSTAKTPTTQRTVTRKAAPPSTNGRASPSRIPSRAPLSNLKNGNNSPERRPPSRGETLRNGAPVRAPPPKMRDLKAVPELGPPSSPYKGTGLDMTLVRGIEPEDVYLDESPVHRLPRSDSNLTTTTQQSYYDEYSKSTTSSYPMAPPARDLSSISGGSRVVSGNENWETYDDTSEPEADASDAYYAKLRAARCKRNEPDYGSRPQSGMAKRVKGIPPPKGYTGPVMIDEMGNRVVSGSEWTDEDMF